MGKNTFGKITLYRIDDIDIENLVVEQYELVRSDEIAVEGENVIYWLYFYQSEPDVASWYKGFLPILPKPLPGKKPKLELPGFILFIQMDQACYAVVGGQGVHQLRKAAKIEPRFGQKIFRKVADSNEMTGLTQKDTGGKVNHLERIFRSNYEPAFDTANLKRIPTHIRAKLKKENPLYKKLGLSIDGGDSLRLTGQKTFEELLESVVLVEQVYTEYPDRLRFPQLEEIREKQEGELVNRLKSQLADTLAEYDSDKDSFFLDNWDYGFLPDRVSEYGLVEDEKKPSMAPTYFELFCRLKVVLNEFAADERPGKLDQFQVKFFFDEGYPVTAPLMDYLCGDVTLDGEVYFIQQGAWFRASQEYLDSIDERLNQIPCISASSLRLNEWDLGEYPRESDYNSSNKDYHFLDTCLVDAERLRSGVELCDLFRLDGASAYFVHVKKANGAALRALFAQGYVAAELYVNSPKFRNDVIRGSFIAKAGQVTEVAKADLAKLKEVLHRNVTIVYAIFDEKRPSPELKEPLKTTEVLKGTLSTFAKVDLLRKAEEIEGMHLQLAITRICAPA